MKRSLSLLLTLLLCLSLSAPAAAAEFSDVPAGYVFHAAIQDCAQKGFMSGYADGTFRPAGPVTRAQLCVMLTRAFYSGEEEAHARWKSLGFYGPSAALLDAKGVMVYKDQYWQDAQVMGQSVTRRDMAKFIANLMADKGYTVSEEGKAAARAKIPDYEAVGDFYQDAVCTVFALGIITGLGDGSFGGTSTMTRGQGAVVLYRMAQCMTAAPGVITAPQAKPEAAPTTLTNGKEPTEENVLALIQELRARYPEDVDFSAGYSIGNSSPVRAATHPYPRAEDPKTHTSNTLGCGGWATLVSDELFGQVGFPTRKVPLTEARPGDVVVMLDKNDRLVHVVSVLTRPEAGQDGKVSFTVSQASTQGGSIYRIHWDDAYTWTDGGTYHYDAYTRYPA